MRATGRSRTLCGIAAVAGMLLAVPAAHGQATDAASPAVDVATLSPTPGHNNWYRSGPVTLKVTISSAEKIPATPRVRKNFCGPESSTI